MSISSLNGALGFATQALSGSPASWRYSTGYAGVNESDVKWHAATDIDFGAVQDQRAAPQEVNSEMVPLGGYKGMAYVAGGATINPRLEDAVGVLFQNLLGYSTVASAVNEESLMAPVALPSGSGSAAGVLVGANLGSGKTLVATVLSSGTISAIGNSEKITLAGPTVGEEIVLTPLKSAGAGFTHLSAGSAADAAVTGITLPQITSTGNTRVSLGWFSASAKEHVFSFDPANKACIGWMTVQKLMPKPNCGSTGETFGEEGIDCRLANFRLNVPANGVVSARVDWQGRQPQFYDNPTSWVPDFDDFSSVPISCVLEGGIIVPGFSTSELPITNLSLTMSNNTTQPQQEMVIGSYYPDDFVPMSRAMTITATYKWANADLYRAIMTGRMTSPGAGAYGWSPTPWYSPFWARVAAPNTTTDGLTKYSLTAFAPNVMWSVAAPPSLAGGDLVMLQLQGTVMKPLLDAQKYCEIRLVNDIASYAFA